jgi:hypothetical protein
MTSPATPVELPPDAEPVSAGGTPTPDDDIAPRSIRPVLVAALLALVALWFLGSVVAASDLGHVITHLLPGPEGCGGG